MFRSHYSSVFTTVLAIFMGLFMAIAAVFVDHLSMNFSTVFKIWTMITFIVIVVSIFLPYPQMNAALMKKTGLAQGSLGYKLVSGILPSLILNTFNTVLVSAANILYNPEIPAEAQLGAWCTGILHDWPIMFVLSYIAAFISEAIAGKVANRYVK